MAYEDFTTFTEVDPSNRFSQTTTRNSFTNLQATDDAYVYKDYGVSYFDDFTHDVDYRIISFLNDTKTGFWAITDTPANLESLTEGLVIYDFSTVGGQRLILEEIDGASDTTGNIFSLNTTYYLRITRNDTTITCKIYPLANDRINDTNILDTLSISCSTDAYRYLMCGLSKGSGDVGRYLTGYVENLKFEIPTFEGSDTLILSDAIELSLSLEKAETSESLILSDEIHASLAKSQELVDTLSLSDDIDVLFSKELSDTLTLGDAITVDTVEPSVNDFSNKFGMVNGTIEDVNNDIRTLAINKADIINDVRFLKPEQIPGDAGYLSLGKTYVKVYIDSVEQTDVDVDSITISKIPNSSHNATFILGRPYDNTKPAQELAVEIKYHIWTLYKGYITQILPTSSPDSIRITCQDEYWKQNKTKKYFFVGHKPTDDFELYYNQISTALSTEFSWSPGIGDFVPQVMSLFGTGSSDCISALISNSGNYNWFYHVNKSTGNISKKLWIANQGDIINLEKQEIGKNLGLYQIINHSFRESIENIINKFRVQMGNLVVRRFNDTGGNKRYSSYRYEHFIGSASPDWDSTYERLAQFSPTGDGVFHHPVDKNDLYKDVFTKYSLPSLSSTLEAYSDAFPPLVQILIPFGFWKCSLGEEGYLTEGFSIDYENRLLVFNEPIYLYKTNEFGEMTDIRRPDITVQLWKRKYYSNTESPGDDPTSDISNPLMFFTDKMGDYPETILENLTLSGLSIQIGGWYVSGFTSDGEPIRTYVPSWNDTLFAQDYADWQLSQNYYKKIDGSIEITIDTMCFYDIDLSNRIMIDEVIEEPLNIISISYNIGNWRATLGLENKKYYKRSVSIPSHGE